MKNTIIAFTIGLIIGLSSLYFYKLEVKYYSFNSACQQMGYDYYTSSYATQGACIGKEDVNGNREVFELFISERITEGLYKGNYK